MNQGGLNVIVIGGGLAGLTAAITLRQKGHHVEVFEQSRFANEVGAAIHMTPNATGILKQIGLDPQDSGAVLLRQTRLFTANNSLLSTQDNLADAYRWQNPWLLAHRAHLHSQLKTAATSLDGPGEPVKIHVSSRVEHVDPRTATISFKDGTSRTADVLVGADGVHSVARRSVAPDIPRPKGNGHSAFRFVINRQIVLDDAETHEIASVNGSMDIWYSSEEKIVLYPTFDNKLLNFVCIHSSSKSEATDDYSKTGSKSNLLEIFKDFYPPLVKLLSKVDPAELKIYPLFDLPALPIYVRERLALIGDAAHPFTPHLAQGGAQALEDAVSLGVMLEADLPASSVPERLQLYNEARYARSSKIQDLSRIVGGDKLGSGPDKNHTLSVREWVQYGFSHDEIHASTQRLREYKWKQRPLRWRQPTVFGPSPGPRQDHYGNSHAHSLANSKTTKRTIDFKTSATLLRNLFPGPHYFFDKPDTIAKATFSIESLAEMAWLSGGGYNLLGFYIHGVCTKDLNGRIRKGTYCPIMFENLTDPILTGREELGVPKVFSEIDILEDETSCSVKVGWRGNVFAEFGWGKLNKSDIMSHVAEEETEGLLVHKYMPSHEIGKSVCESDILLHGKPVTTSVRAKRTSTPADVRLQINDLGEKDLPTLHHIISRLAELPVFEIVTGEVTEYRGVTDFSQIERLN